MYEGLRDRFYGLPGTFEIAKCGQCGFGFLDLVPANLSEYYPAKYYSYQPGSAAIQLVRRIASRGLFYLPEAKQGQRVLDVGCGSGEYLERMRELGWIVGGVEKGEQLVNLLHQRGIPAFESLDSALEDNQGPFDLVTFNSSLEHMEDFGPVLQKVRRIIRKGGEVVILAPNIESREHRIFGSMWFHLDPPRHLWHFSPDTLRGALTEAGFDDIRVENVPCPTGFSGSLLYSLGLQFNQMFFYLLMPFGYLWCALVRDGIIRARAVAR
jgi:SAM-dependent methyltransferase